MFKKLTENKNLKLEPIDKMLLGPCTDKVKRLGTYAGKLTVNNKYLDEALYFQRSSNGIIRKNG